MTIERIISADSHVFEPDDLWLRSLGKKWGDQVPRRVHGRPDDPGDYDYDFTGAEYVRKFRRTNLVNQERGFDVRSAGWDPAVRIKCMDQDGVAAELLGPTAGLFVFSAANGAMVRDCFHVYNDWVAEYCSHAPKRLLRVALIQMADVDAAIADLEKAG
ncbi:MAG: hypothetical protein FJX57_16525, partial [Alphaproteobacteria bacterium]|nr:hypothetical protein [Alphaproteobacteria bacterium]